MKPRLNRREVILEDAVKIGVLLPFEAGPLEDEVQEAIEAFQSQQHWIQIHAIRQGKTTFKVLFCFLFNLKVFTNEKRGGLKVVAIDRSSFKLFSLRFSNKSVEALSCEWPNISQRTLFLSFEIINCFSITV
jgi:hypothetical protein